MVTTVHPVSILTIVIINLSIAFILIIIAIITTVVAIAVVLITISPWFNTVTLKTYLKKSCVLSQLTKLKSEFLLRRVVEITTKEVSIISPWMTIDRLTSIRLCL